MAKDNERGGAGMHFGGILEGLNGLMDKLTDLAEAGEKLKRTGEMEFEIKEGQEAKGVFGFSVKMGLGEQGDSEVQVEPFGNVYRNKKTGKTEIKDVREPLVDIFEEEDHVLLVGEMPGINQNDLKLELKDDILILAAERGDKKYRKEMLLPEKFSEDSMTIRVKNGVVEIKLERVKTTT
ncbi:Hsp20/alpha crystallin family protein [Spartinivicinus poritis]|uniref:Hsp20 family protein n=1 Tax=Spartinivicinus poritis TaxID=2994640 RepID=A0ABT5U532_9GAMM|nr:Hsp20 family protein [Spartinivicinus sp. A2-2]MDE1461464.1 Hsp20 family protein [Spartinivicinus sp. A2-2]